MAQYTRAANRMPALLKSQWVGGLTGQAVAWKMAHSANQRDNKGFGRRMGRHLGYNIAGAFGGTALGAAAYMGYRALR
jgi:hypothetical protein